MSLPSKLELVATLTQGEPEKQVTIHCTVIFAKKLCCKVLLPCYKAGCYPSPLGIHFWACSHQLLICDKVHQKLVSTAQQIDNYFSFLFLSQHGVQLQASRWVYSPQRRQGG